MACVEPWSTSASLASRTWWRDDVQWYSGVNAVETHALRTRAARGSAMFALRHVGTMLGSLVAGVFLARWLAPCEFGAFAAVSFWVLGIAGSVGDLGVGTALVRSTHPDPSRLYRSVRALSRRISIAAAVCTVVATVVLVWLDRDMLALWVGLLGAAFVARSSRILPHAHLQRELRFGSIAMIELADQGLYFATALLIAATGGGTTALVLGVTAKEFLGAILMWRAARIGPLPADLEPEGLRELLRIGLPVQASGLFVSATDAFIPIVIGGFLGLQQLGYVSWAYNLAMIPLAFLAVVDRILVPIFARAPKPEILRSWLGRAIRLNALFAFPIVVALATCVEGIIRIVFDPRWLPAGDLILAFLPAVVCTAITAPLLQAFTAIGRTKVAMWLAASWVCGTWTVGAAVVGVAGLTGFRWFYVALQLTFIPVWVMASRTLGLRLLHESFGPLVGLGVAVLVGRSLPDPGGLIGVLAVSSMSVVCFAAVSISLDRRVWRDARMLLRSLRAAEATA